MKRKIVGGYRKYWLITIWPHKNISPWEKQTPLVMSLINGGKTQGSPNLKSDNVVSGPQTSTNALQTQFKIMKRAVAKCPKGNITIMGETCLHCWILVVWLA